MEKTTSMLNAISKLYNREKQVELRKRKEGEYFNIFNTIGLRTEEVRLHSAFIAELLNPKGSHGLEHRFLQAFLETIGVSVDYLDFHRCSENMVERVIGPVTDTEGGRIDIILKTEVMPSSLRIKSMRMTKRTKCSGTTTMAEKSFRMDTNFFT